MSSSSSSTSCSSSSSSSSKLRIRIVVPPSSNLETPARKPNGHHEVSPTPCRDDVVQIATDDKPRANDGTLRDLSPKILENLRNGDLEFPINEECTSLKIVPNGRLLVAGFTDGTLRLFDLTGRPTTFSSSDEENAKRSRQHAVVCSKTFQKFGAVASQIHARGVHTSLLMHVDCSEDGLFCFGGVARGSVELVAIDLSKVVHSSSCPQQQQDLLDSIQVHRHADAKLKGFGACTRLTGTGPTPKYLLLTGKGIKNIHIWSFEPSSALPEETRWQCLYDTQTNGNSISILHFRKDPHGLLQAVSKSDNQKLRVWDLSYEQHQGDSSHFLFGKVSVISALAKKTLLERPKRPPYVDVASTESAFGIAGAFSFGGAYNQVSVVGLDVEHISSPYNITEMALPGNPASSQQTTTTSRRQQRGDLQSIIRVAGMSKDASHVLLELDNGSVVHYSQDYNHSSLQVLPMFHAEGSTSRNLCLDRIASSGLVVAAMSTYNANTGRGSILLRPLDSNDAALAAASPMADKRALAAATMSAPSPTAAPGEGYEFFMGAGHESTPDPMTTNNNNNNNNKPTTKVAARVFLEEIKSKTIKSPPQRVVVSFDGNQRKTTKSPPQGVAVSPELKGELLEASNKKTQKQGAMIKYLCPANAADRAAMAKAVPRRLHPEPKPPPREALLDDQPSKVAAAVVPRKTGMTKAAPQQALDDKPLKAPKIAAAVVPRKTGEKLALMKKNKSQSDTHTTAEQFPSTGTKTKTLLESLKSDPTSEMVKKANAKRTRSKSPSIPRKRQEGPFAVAKRDATPTRNDSLAAEDEVAATLCDSQRGTASPKRLGRSQFNGGSTYLKTAACVLTDEVRPIHPRRKRPRMLTDQLPTTTVKDRLGTLDCDETREIHARQEASRIKLAAEHRAGHEMLRRKVVSTVDGMIRALTRSPPISDNKARIWFSKAIDGYKDMLEDMLARQEMEASALAAEQALESKGYAPELQVSFPFPDLFVVANSTLARFLLEEAA